MTTRDEISSALQQIERTMSRTVRLFQNAMKGRKGQLANVALAKIRRVPGDPVYPIRWTNERQRRAFFASKGFGRGIPTKRTNKIINAWDAEFVPTDDGGMLVMSNPYEAAQFIFGPNTQGFHLDTGYVQLDDVAQDFFNEAEDAAVVVFYADCDPLQELA